MKPRRLGMEQELFVVEPGGEASQRADELLRRCAERAPDAAIHPANFATEWVKNVIELNTSPQASPEALRESHGRILGVALAAAQDIGVRLYPYSVYPIHFIPVMRDEMNYHVQVRTVGRERFLNAGKCAGVHLHIEVPQGTIDPRVAVAYGSSPEDRQELLNVYNLATALDPVIIALTRACPFYEGRSTGIAHRTARYRGNAEYGWEGVYVDLPAVGGLQPYAEDVEGLVNLQFQRHYAWMDALDAAQVERRLFFEAGGNLLKSSWNPVRLNPHGTVELRNFDSNLPEIIFGVVSLVHQLHQRVLREGLTVRPGSDFERMEVDGQTLCVPDFEHLRHQLLFAAVNEGIGSERVAAYVASAIEAAGAQPGSGGLGDLIPDLGTFQTTEARLLEAYFPEGEVLGRDVGLQLVRDACDEFEARIEASQGAPSPAS